jgi:hypothetical protein
MLLMSVIFLPAPSKASSTPLLKVEPQISSFRTDLHQVGYQFTVSIIIENVPEPGFYGWELVLSWTPGIIDCVGETINFNLWKDPATGKYYYNGPWVTEPIDNTAGTYWQSLTGKAPAEPSTGTFWLVNLTFQIVEPPPYGGEVSTTLHLAPKPPSQYCIADKTATPIPHGFQDGLYRYLWAPPSVVPHLAVDPASYRASKIGEEFDIKVLIKNVDPGWWLAGVQFIFTYNTSILDAKSVTPGTFFDPYTTQTWFYEEIFENEGKIRIAYIILDIPGYTTPASGSGLIATIHFNATAQGLFPEVLSCDLLLRVDVEAGCQSYFANRFAEEIPYGTPEQGYYEIIPKVLGRRIDVYTQWPAPYGGQGPNQPSDMFWPQKEVILYANVSYNEWPEQNKDVAFQVIDPHGNTYTILYARTNASGVATTSFRLPWPCDDPEYYFGEWKVIATVDIACQIVNDTVTFKYDYIVRITKVTTDKPTYAHCENMNITVEFKSQKIVPMNVTIAVTVLDETGVPFGFVYVTLPIGGAKYCSYKNYTIEVSIQVVKWARAGTAKIIVGALNNWPFEGGTVISRPFPAKEVSILAQ